MELEVRLQCGHTAGSAVITSLYIFHHHQIDANAEIHSVSQVGLQLITPAPYADTNGKSSGRHIRAQRHFRQSCLVCYLGT